MRNDHNAIIQPTNTLIMTVCPLVIGGQITHNGILMIIQHINLETCSCECIYYDKCLKKFGSLNISHICFICKTKIP